MARLRLTVTVRAWLDDADRAAFERDAEALILRFGDEPAPHLKRQAEAEWRRIMDVLKECVQLEVVPT